MHFWASGYSAIQHNKKTAEPLFMTLRGLCEGDHRLRRNGTKPPLGRYHGGGRRRGSGAGSIRSVRGGGRRSVLKKFPPRLPARSGRSRHRYARHSLRRPRNRAEQQGAPGRALAGKANFGYFSLYTFFRYCRPKIGRFWENSGKHRIPTEPAFMRVCELLKVREKVGKKAESACEASALPLS